MQHSLKVASNGVGTAHVMEEGKKLLDCPPHLIRNSFDYAAWKDRELLAKAFKPIYQAVDADEAQRAWDKVIPLFAFPPAVRELIYTINAIESLNNWSASITLTVGVKVSDAKQITDTLEPKPLPYCLDAFEFTERYM